MSDTTKFPFRIIGIIPKEQILETLGLEEYGKWMDSWKNHVKHYLVQLALPPLRHLGLF